MLDLRFIRDNVDAVQRNCNNRNVSVDVSRVAALYDSRNTMLQQIESLRQHRNKNAKQMKGTIEQQHRTTLIAEGRELKEQLASLETRLSETEAELDATAKLIPNISHPDAPVGREESDNVEIRRVGRPPTFDFEPKDHVELAEALGIIDFETAAKVSGAKYYYLRGKAVYLELALIRYAMDIAQKHGFLPHITPDIARTEIIEGIGFNPRGAESNIYGVEDTDTCLIGTAEITLGAYHADSILDAQRLPIKMAGLSHCFRREAGAAGQYSRGLYRVHQFTKVELFAFVEPEASETMLEEILALEEEVYGGLGIAYRIVDTCTGDLGGPAYRKFDIEAWMPGRGENGSYGEVTSASNCTDYQARRLSVRYRAPDGKVAPLHMLNGTAVAVSRAIVSILENYQQPDGSVRMPEMLVPYLGFEAIGSDP